MPKTSIPNTVWEGYSRCRVLWFSHEAKDLPNLTARNAADQAAAQRIAQDNLRTLREVAAKESYAGGIWLSTKGESDIETAGWSKDTANPAGTLSVTLLPRQNYLKLIRPSDVMLVYMRGDKRTPEVLLTLVSVDSVNEVRTVTPDGATTIRVLIQARDLGKVLMETPTIFSPEFGFAELESFFPEFTRPFQKDLIASGPSRVVMQIISSYFAIRGNIETRDGPDTLKQWRFPGNPNASLFSLLDSRTFVQVPMVGGAPINPTMLQSSANLWSLCDMYSNRVVNEFFIDVRDLVPGAEDSVNRAAVFAQRFLQANGVDTSDDTRFIKDADAALTPDLGLDFDDLQTELGRVSGQNDQRPKKTLHSEAMHDSVIALVHRQLPYDTFSFFMLPGTVVDETEVFESNIVKSTHEVFNYFRVRMPGVVEGVVQEFLSGIDINRESIARHGLRRYEGQSIYPFISADKLFTKENGIAALDYYLQLVTCWFAFMDRMWSGTLVMRLRPDIRVGTRLVLHRTHLGVPEIIDFYVQAIQHNYGAQPGSSRTVAQVVRGVEREDRERRPEGNLFWKDTGRDLGEFDPYEIVVSGKMIHPSQRKPTVPTTDTPTDDSPTGGVEPGETPDE